MSVFPRRFAVLATGFLIVGGLLGSVLGSGSLADSQRGDEDIFAFGRILSLVEDQYVGDADSKELVEDAIEGLLHRLDPHSNYLNAESFNEMRDEQRGKFSGLGIQITKRGPDKPLTIIAPIDGTPAHRAGLLSGDVISHIEGEPTIELTVQGAVRLLKGEKGTAVTITIKRPGLKAPFDVTIERDDIPIESIRVAFMLDDNVGLVRIANFTSTTADELDAAVARLEDEGMTRLLLDLRGNPGGLLDQAVQVSERFVPAGELVVYTRGRISGSNQDYFAERGTNTIDLPLVLLVDSSSASASEIVSGAVQDHDRGLVVGEPTFGKGLVQRVIPLQDGGALAVTTAKYYTPSGRLIQRDYTDLEAYYLKRGEDEGDEANPSDTPQDGEQEPREIFYTASGRKVYGGGGIRPDYIVEAERAPEILFSLLRENLVFDFAVQYTNAHADLSRSFRVDDALMAQFREFLFQREFDLDEAAFDENIEALGVRLHAQIARVKWDQIEESRVLADADPQVRKALTLFEEAAELASLPARERPTGGAADLRAQALD